MTELFFLMNISRPRQARKRVGRGPGSGLGKTCGRGEKGAGSRAGYSRRSGYEGGQFRTFMKMPIRGFSNARFRKELPSVNLEQLEAFFEDGEEVNLASLRACRLVDRKARGVKILGRGELSKKLSFNVSAFSAGAREKLRHVKLLDA